MMKIGISLGVRSYLKKEKSSILMISNFSPSAFEPIMQELAMGGCVSLLEYQDIKKQDTVIAY